MNDIHTDECRERMRQMYACSCHAKRRAELMCDIATRMLAASVGEENLRNRLVVSGKTSYFWACRNAELLVAEMDSRGWIRAQAEE